MMRPALRLISGRPGPQAGAGGMQAAADRALAEGVARGEREAVAALTRRCLPMVHALSFRLLGDSSEAEDAAQDVFVKVWRKIGSYDPGRAKLETWVARIAINTCHDRLRKRRERPLAGDVMPEREDPAPGADQTLAAGQSAEQVRQAIAALPERQRMALELRHFQDMSQAEAAACLEISEEALESLLARARRGLKAALLDEAEGMIRTLSEGRGGEA
ncbi:sigma-70 family RNA polymerase sigma factor [Alkalicaulis satelles]|uniref:Sigma-70 family RNA polymerase sigma factor n=1 Tax=Alkalicaulis satelles TaxID=2609175 RepID=A0A5M6ZPJ1_9PROT|nr:sigma-70 family RNA polymerase sigma factor [Alkalicaulis satelles]KAA5805158.1 sigma-70 family RNA polymerase sigma factor [Alkalicaulis satelles]